MTTATMSNSDPAGIVSASSAAFGNGKFANGSTLPQVIMNRPLVMSHPRCHGHISTNLEISDCKEQDLYTVRVERPRISHGSNSTGLIVMYLLGSVFLIFFFLCFLTSNFVPLMSRRMRFFSRGCFF